MTKDDLYHAAIVSGVVDEAAVHDAESYDGGATLAKLDAMYSALSDEPSDDSYKAVTTDDRILTQQELKNAWAHMRGPAAAAEADIAGHMRALEANLRREPLKAEYCPLHPDVQIVVRPSTSVNGGSIGWGCAVCNCLEVERLRGFVSDEERAL